MSERYNSCVLCGLAFKEADDIQVCPQCRENMIDLDAFLGSSEYADMTYDYDDDWGDDDYDGED